jgi:phage N-6-adenine-methyltransferase
MVTSMLPSLPDAEVRQEWETPDVLWQGLHAEFNFDLDVAANAANAKTLQFISRTMDGLKHPWDGRRVWCNPPYKNIAPWVELGVTEAASKGTTCVFLLPARTEQHWFRKALHHSTEIAFFDGRIQFTPPHGVPASSNREGSLLVVFGPSKFGRVETVRCNKTGKVLHTWARQ